MNNFIETYDKNKDGEISREEWKDYHIQLFDDLIKKDLDKRQKPSKWNLQFNLGKSSCCLCFI